MAFKYTPTPTPSITPTKSLTPSITPTNTPTGTVCPGLTPTITLSNTATPTNTPSITPTHTITPTNTSTPSPTPILGCYSIFGLTTDLGECFTCPNTYASFTEYYIQFLTSCGGTQIPCPITLDVIAHYSDLSTETTTITIGTTGNVPIAASSVQCGTPPGCETINSPTFVYADVIPIIGSINSCC
jgi:hypothetical protein